MALSICIILSVLVGLVVLLRAERPGRPLSSRIRESLGIVAILAGVSFIASFLIAIQGDPYRETELISSQSIEDIGYGESSTRYGELIGNYTYRMARTDDSGARFLVTGSVPADSTSLYIDEDLKEARLEQRQGYWYEPRVFPWRIWSFQPYRIYSPEDPR